MIYSWPRWNLMYLTLVLHGVSILFINIIIDIGSDKSSCLSNGNCPCSTTDLNINTFCLFTLSTIQFHYVPSVNQDYYDSINSTDNNRCNWTIFYESQNISYKQKRVHGYGNASLHNVQEFCETGQVTCFSDKSFCLFRYFISYKVPIRYSMK